MKFAEAAQLISCLPYRQTTLMLGPPGIGKTSLAYAVGTLLAEQVGGVVILGDRYDEGVKAEAETAAKEGRKPRPPVIVEVRDLCSHLPEDLLGLPKTVTFENRPVTDYAPPIWLARLSRPGVYGVLVLDDIAAASPAIQVAAYKLALERRSGDCALSNNVKLMLTANRKEDKSNATTLPAALRNRCWIENIDVDVDGWCEWAAKSGLPGDVPAFVRFRPGHLSKLPKDQDEKNGQFATPRTWEMLGLALNAAKEKGKVAEVATGLVGEGVATEFAAFVKIRDTVADPKAILFDPQKALPDPPTSKNADRLIAYVTAVAEVAAPLSVEKGKDAKEIPPLLLAALNHITRGGREYASHGILHFAQYGGNVAALIKTAREGRNDPRFKDLLQHLKGSLLPQ